MHDTLPLLEQSDFPFIHRQHLETLQVNITLRCNQQCFHCHVNASPKRTESMDDDTIDTVMDFLQSGQVKTLDITGGAPELHPRFRDLVVSARNLDLHVIDRCNLTILLEAGQEDLTGFLAENNVEIIASMPCYEAANVDRQRGDGVFDKSVQALQKLNAAGYGCNDTGLILNLVYNPQGPSLPPVQEKLEIEYKKHLWSDYSISFNNLYTLCNMPIKRFGSALVSSGQFHDYMALLKRSHEHQNLEKVMCRSLISIDWQGYLYDCDFNQMLDLPLRYHDRPRLHISDLIDIDLTRNPVTTCDHCFGCTAGQGSSCGGALK